MKVFVIGYMGAGKSGLGREAARRAGIKFLDTDRMIEQACSATVNEIFAQHGEAYFRAREREILERAANEEGDVVIATGGGLPCVGDAMEFMNAHGRTVYLRFGVDKLLHRLQTGLDRRPKLHGMNPAQLRDYVTTALQEREPYYNRASMVVDCDRLSDDSACNYIALSATG